MYDDKFGYNAALPENIREIFAEIVQDVVWLNAKWDFFLELFSSQENTALLHDMALGSFNIIFDSIRNDVLIGICRLSDPEKTSRNVNLSLETLGNRCLHLDNIEALVKQFKEDCSPVQKMRNKKIAHTDLNTIIHPTDYPLPGISKIQIETILQEASEILNRIYSTYVDGELSFKLRQVGDGKSLIHWLKTAKDFEEEKLRRLREGIAGSEAHR